MPADLAQMAMMAQPGAMMSPTVREAADQMPLTSEKIAQSMDVDTESPEFLTGSVLAPGPPGSSAVKLAKVGSAVKKIAGALPVVGAIKKATKAKLKAPAGGSKQLEKFGEQVGYIPPTTGTEMEERARLLAGLVDPIPGVPVGSVKQTQVFTSPAVKAVSEIKQNKMPANQWISQMKSRGVKQDELTWTGVEDWLKSQDKSVTKQDLDEYLEANQIQVQEVVKGTADQSAKDRVIRAETANELDVIMDNDFELYEMREDIVPMLDQYRAGDETVIPELNGLFGRYIDPDTGETAIQSIERKNIQYFDDNPREFERKAEGLTEYSHLTLPGGENYRELLLTFPSRIDPRRKRLQELSGKKREELTDAARQERLDLLDLRRTGQFKDTQDFTSGHYKEPNIVAHIRFNERVDADGNKVLFIEEIQSDWAQKGRKEGFKTDYKPLTLENAEITETDTQYLMTVPQEDLGILKGRENFAVGKGVVSGRKGEFGAEEYFDRYIKNLEKEALQKENLKTTPQAPFVMDTNQWTSLALKRMVRWATDNDFDQIAWTTGKQQAKRYDLSKQVDQISYKKNEDGTYVLLITPKGSNAALDTIQNQNMKSVPENKLEDIIGKELAKKIVNKEGEAFTNLSYMNEAKTQEDMTFRKFTGVDLEVGGEGMGAFYDKILVDRAKKLGKQYGSKVEKGELPQLKNIEIVEDQGGFIVNELSEDGTTVLNENFFETRGFAEEFARGLEQTGGGKVIDDPTVWTMNLTDKLKKAAKDGLPYYVVLPPIVAGVASQQAEASEVKKPAVQVKSNRIMEEAMP